MERRIIASGVIQDLASDFIDLRNAGFALLYETGAPVPVSALAEKSGMGVGEIETALVRPDVAGRVRLNDNSEVVGIAGLSVEPTSHELHLDDRQFWTWCALDAVGIMAALGATGYVVSNPPDGAHALTIEFVDGRAVTDHSIFILSDVEAPVIYESWCPNVNFFSSHDAAGQWASENALDGQVLSVGDIAEAAGAMWEPVVADDGA